MWTAGKEAVTIAKNKEQLGITLPWYGGSGQARAEFVEGAGTAAEGFIFGTGKSLVPRPGARAPRSTRSSSDFAERYEAAYGEAPDIFAGHAFDAMNILDRRAQARPERRRCRERSTPRSRRRRLIGFGGTSRSRRPTTTA